MRTTEEKSKAEDKSCYQKLRERSPGSCAQREMLRAKESDVKPGIQNSIRDKNFPWFVI